jgi:hypothetical protein
MDRSWRPSQSAVSLPQLLECGNRLIQAVQFLVEQGQHFHEIHILA